MGWYQLFIGLCFIFIQISKNLCIIFKRKNLSLSVYSQEEVASIYVGLPKVFLVVGTYRFILYEHDYCCFLKPYNCQSIFVVTSCFNDTHLATVCSLAGISRFLPLSMGLFLKRFMHYFERPVCSFTVQSRYICLCGIIHCLTLWLCCYCLSVCNILELFLCYNWVL